MLEKIALRYTYYTYVELRDDIYGYATKYTKPPSDGLVHVSRSYCSSSSSISPQEIYSGHTGLPFTCRQIYEEYQLCHKKSKRISVRLKDANDYVSTFFPPTKPITQPCCLTIIEDDAQKHPSATPRVNILPLIRWTFSDLELELELNFAASQVDPSRRAPYPDRSQFHQKRLVLRAIELTDLVSRLIAEFGLTPNQTAPTNRHSPSTLDSVWLSWSDADRCEIQFLLSGDNDSLWIDERAWQYTGDIAATIRDRDSGAIPKGYLSEEEEMWLKLCTSLGLDKCTMRWDINIDNALKEDGVPGGSIQSTLWPWGVSTGNTWQSWACGTLQDRTKPNDYSWANAFCDGELADNGSETNEEDGFETEDPNSLQCVQVPNGGDDLEMESEDEEDEDISEDLREEIEWLRENNQLHRVTYWGDYASESEEIEDTSEDLREEIEWMRENLHLYRL